MKKIAICLYGQPREYKKFYENIKYFIDQQKQNYIVDVFFHCWNIENGQIYDASKWRNIDKNTLICYDKNKINSELLELYNPTDYKFENAIHKFDEKMYMDTIAYKNISTIAKKENINNTLSQIYSRTEVTKILKNHIEKNNFEYEYVVMTRFDFNSKINLSLDKLDNKKSYVSKNHYPRNLPCICLLFS